MSYELETIGSPEEFSAAVGEIASGESNHLILGHWPTGGLLEFAGIAFPGVDIKDIFAKHHTREPQGHEPHFDVYKSFVNDEMPWLGHFNISGDANVFTTELAPDLAEAYERRYPIQSPEAADARRHFARIALEEPGANVGHGTMTVGTRMVLPVRPNGPHIIHNIPPIDPAHPGEFVKLIVATSSSEERGDLQSEAGYMPLDDYLSRAIGFATTEAASQEKTAEKQAGKKTKKEEPTRVTPITTPQRRSTARTTSTFSRDRDTRRRRCSGLD